ncbi:MAG: hypothetical protein U1C59_13855 [Methylotenera sp.]|nr:hypothetical protein [Methylotenera sp.]
MKKYSLSSTSFTGEVIFEFNDLGFLTKFDTSQADLNESHQRWILREMPNHIDDIKRVLGNSKTAILTELSTDVTFQMFWDRYNEKIRSSRKRSEAKWNRMSQADRNRAYWWIGKYELTLTGNREKKYAESYLNAEQWNN